MAKLYNKNTWQDEVLGGDERYNVLADDGTVLYSNVRIELATAVVQAGTAADAAKMNNIEDGVDGLDTKLADLDPVEMVDYQDLSTIIGWSSFTTKSLIIYKIGKIRIVAFQIEGTGSGTSVSFTLPDATRHLVRTSVQVRDNSGTRSEGFVQFSTGTTTASFYTTWIAGAWTDGGIREIRGSFVYFTY